VVARLAARAGASASTRRASGAPPLYDVTVPCSRDRHMALGFAELVRAAAIPTEGVRVARVAVLPPPRPAARPARAAPALARRDAAAVDRLHPGSGDNFPGRRWPIERFADRGARLARRSAARSSSPAAERAPLSPSSRAARRAPRRRRELAGALDLPMLVALLARADLLLSNDTGRSISRRPSHAGRRASTARTRPALRTARRRPSRALPAAALQPLPHEPNGKSSAATLPLCILRIPSRRRRRGGAATARRASPRASSATP
jgi:hypothetical protein